MIKIISNGSKWHGEKPDSLELLKEVLKSEALDPTFEKYGNFANRNPQWVKKDAQEEYKGCSVIFGNFYSYSHVFNIITDDEELIMEFESLVNKNKMSEGYLKAKKNLEVKDKV